MSAVTELLPLQATIEPGDAAEVREAILSCKEEGTPVYPIGGGASLDQGLPAKQPGLGLSLAGMNRLVDYPARDLTVTVEAGMTFATLADTLAKEWQRLPLDIPFPERATIGGVAATAWCGARRLGHGSPRDYVIGISAVDGRGRLFKGGGRVVKNVAGYDFCKLLTGSFGTLAVITQVTFKLKPAPEHTALLVCPLKTIADAERLLVDLAQSRTAPVAVELLGGADWRDEPLLMDAGGGPFRLLAGFEGTVAEVAWQKEQLSLEWMRLGAAEPRTIEGEAAQLLWRRLAEFPARQGSPLVLKAAVRPSGVARMIAAIRNIDGDASIQAHAASGVVLARFAVFPKAGLSRTLIGELQPAAAAEAGHVVILANPGGAEMTRQAVWGGGDALPLMAAVKREFDPDDLLNRGRFVFA